MTKFPVYYFEVLKKVNEYLNIIQRIETLISVILKFEFVLFSMISES